MSRFAERTNASMSAVIEAHPERSQAVPEFKSSKTPLPSISSQAFVSETDRMALENLKKVPLLPMVLRKFHELAWDRISYARNSAESVRCGPKQFRSLHNMLREACSVLHVTEPELYVRESEVLNAYTSGTNRTFIVLHSALVQHFTDDEILFIIGHEVGHIKCGHVLYQEMGRMLMPLLEMVGQATLGLGQLAGAGLVAAFFEWMRQAEFSCDRAGTLVCQDTRVALSGVMKLGCGSSRFDDEKDLDTFLEQARTHSETVGVHGLSKALLFVMYNWQLTHPQVVYRAKGLDDWINSGAYERIIGGDYIRDVAGASQLGEQTKCPQCKKTVSTLVRFCPECGHDFKPQMGPNGERVAPQIVACGSCGEQLPFGTKFCVSCGTATA
ncbi:MAG: M48 family metallopeptidase [Cytophagales bacterium]|nr:M48 family metallopeptidase [Armatimonadota bacterium]